jgi:DnaK suppressor protein
MSKRLKSPPKRKSATAVAARPSKPAKGLGKRDEGKFRKQLLNMRDNLAKTVEQKKQQDLPASSVGDEADQATQSLEKEILFELNDNERNMLDQIEGALRKMQKGAFGFCESCRKPIALPRLKALPFARYCIACQGTMEHAII